MRSKCSRRRTSGDLAAGGRVERRHHLEALHARLQRVHRVDLADDHLRAGAARS
jgi:hypothetical protein